MSIEMKLLIADIEYLEKLGAKIIFKKDTGAGYGKKFEAPTSCKDIVLTFHQGQGFESIRFEVDVELRRASIIKGAVNTNSHLFTKLKKHFGD